MLSGFLMFYTSRSKDLSQIKNIGAFYKKRLADIMPLYLVAAVIFVLTIDRENLLDNLFLAPVELLGLQSVFSSLFSVSHNGGTWFISCMLICYGIFPFLSELLKQMTGKQKAVCAALSLFVLLYALLVVNRFVLHNIYSNPFFRALEFFLGAILAASMPEFHEHTCFHRFFSSKTALLVEIMVLITAVSAAVARNIGVGDYMLYNWICAPVFLLMLYTLASVQFKNGKHRIVAHLSEISYAFFLAQFFNYPIVKRIMEAGVALNNVTKIVLSLTICLLLSVGFHELAEKPLGRLMRRWL